MKNSLKTIIAVLSIAVLTSLVFTSCSKDTDPADKDFFVGKYTGHISYVDNSSEDATTIEKDDGSVEVVKVGDTYNFVFSDGIPDITGIEMEKGDNSAINVGSDESHIIQIDEDKLVIGYAEDGKVWTANANR